MSRGHTHIGVGHHFDIIDENHADIGDWFGHAGQPVLGFEPVKFLIGHFEGDMAVAGFHLGDAAGGVGDEFDRHGFEFWRAAPIILKGFEPDKGVAFEFFDHIGAAADQGGFKSVCADLFVVFFGIT